MISRLRKDNCEGFCKKRKRIFTTTKKWRKKSVHSSREYSETWTLCKSALTPLTRKSFTAQSVCSLVFSLDLLRGWSWSPEKETEREIRKNPEKRKVYDVLFHIRFPGKERPEPLKPSPGVYKRPRKAIILASKESKYLGVFQNRSVFWISVFSVFFLDPTYWLISFQSSDTMDLASYLFCFAAVAADSISLPLKCSKLRLFWSPRPLLLHVFCLPPHHFVSGLLH